MKKFGFFVFITVMLFILLFILCRIIRLIALRKIIRDMYIDLIRRLNDNNVQYWTDFGTLLGIMRDNDIIIGDNDADICIVPTKENIEKCEKVVNQMGGEYLDWGAFRVYSYGRFVDIYIPTIEDKEDKEKDKEDKEKEKQYKNPTGELIDVNDIHPIEKKQVDIGGVIVNVSMPSNIEVVLEKRYGDWKKTKRNWSNFHFDPEKEPITIGIEGFLVFIFVALFSAYYCYYLY